MPHVSNGNITNSANSAASQFAVNTGDYMFDYSPVKADTGSSFWNGFLDFFTLGNRNKQAKAQQGAKDAYNSMIANKLEEDRLNSARAFDLYMDSTKYQRAVEDAKKAGINPYMLFQQNLATNGTSSAQSVQAQKPRAMKSDESSNNLLSTALKILGLLALK